MRKLEKFQLDKKVNVLAKDSAASIKGGTAGDYIDLLDWSIGVNDNDDVRRA